MNSYQKFLKERLNYYEGLLVHYDEILNDPYLKADPKELEEMLKIIAPKREEVLPQIEAIRKVLKIKRR